MEVAKPEDVIVRNIEGTKLKIFKELRDLLEEDQRLAISRSRPDDPDDVLDPVQKLHTVRHIWNSSYLMYFLHSEMILRVPTPFFL